MECALVPWDQGQVWVTLDSDAFVCLLLVLLDSLGLMILHSETDSSYDTHNTWFPIIVVLLAVEMGLTLELAN